MAVRHLKSTSFIIYCAAIGFIAFNLDNANMLALAQDAPDIGSVRACLNGEMVYMDVPIEAVIGLPAAQQFLEIPHDVRITINTFFEGTRDLVEREIGAYQRSRETLSKKLKLDCAEILSQVQSVRLRRLTHPTLVEFGVSEIRTQDRQHVEKSMNLIFLLQAQRNWESRAAAG